MTELKYKLDFNIYYNNGLARMEIADFENEHHIIKKGSRGTDYLAVFDNWESSQKPKFSKSALRRMKKDDLFDLAYLLDLRVIADQTKQDLINDLITITRERYYGALYERGYSEELECAIDFTATGHDQGEAIRVINADKLKHITRQCIENLYFNTPIYARVDIYDEDDETLAEIFIDEYMDSLYEMDRDSLVATLKKYPSFENMLIIKAIEADITVLNISY